MPQGIWYLSVLVHRRTIFRPVKSTPKSALIRDKIAKIGQIGPRRPYFTFAMLKNTQSWKSTPWLVVTVVTNIICAPGTFLPFAHELRVREENSVEFGENWISFLQNLGFNVFPQVGSLKAIPAHLDVLYQKALEEGYQNYVKSGRFHGFWREMKIYSYKDKYQSFVNTCCLWQLWWWLFEICKITRIKLSLTSYEFVVKSYSTWDLQAPGTVGNENECHKKRAETKRLFLPRPVSFLLPKYTSEFSQC